MKFFLFHCLFLFLTLCTNCLGGDMDNYKSISDVPIQAWIKLADQKIYFGHQSVGDNILEGIRDVMNKNPQIKLNLVETTDFGSFDAGVFAHSKVGKNVDPKSKIDAFAEILENGAGNKVNIAFLKYCFADVNDKTDINKVFDDYQKILSNLKAKYEHVKFVHMTIPLTTVQSGIKASIKKIIGRPVDGYDKNINRELYNEKLRTTYGGKELIFDIAKIESTLPDGTRSSFKESGMTYYSLAPEYTYDGGHLNEKGRKLVAEQLLIFLANATD